MTARRLNLEPGDHIEALLIEHVLEINERAATYLVTDRHLGKRYVLRECLPAAHARRDEEDCVLSLGPEHDKPFARALDLFRAEGRLLASLDERYVARAVRLFEANGTAYCQLAWEEGERLSEHLEKSGRMDAESVRVLLAQLASALESLHEAGDLQLSVSPANIWLKDDGTPLLLDFHPATKHRLQHPVRAVSTPYAAPEMAAEPTAPGQASDIYSLCAVAYHCLTGSAPVLALDRTRAVEQGEADPLATIPLQIDASGLGGLGDAVDLGLRLDPADRPGSIAEWRQALDSIDWRRQVAVSPPEAEKERPEWLSPMLLGALLTVLAVAAAYLLFWPDVTPPVETAEKTSPVVAEPAIPAEETRQWQTALQADTVLAYRRFLEEFPESFYQNQAGIQLDILDERNWDELSKEDTLPAYRRYLELFPQGQHQAEALRRIDQIEQALSAEERQRLERERRDDADWLAARNAQSVAAIDHYLETWPAGLHQEEAHELRKTLTARELESRAWTAATRMNTQAAYQAYLDTYPDGEHRAEALITLEHLDLSPGKAFRDCAACPPMMVLPAGEFRQGASEDEALAANNEKPRHVVRIERPFAIGVREVTFEEWDACVADGGCSHRPEDNGWGRGAQPVIMVSWNDAQEYVAWLSEKTRQNYRLPSESEWEYAARAGEEGPWQGGAAASLCDFANIAGAETDFRWKLEDCADSRALGTLPAGSLAANPFGLHDTIGNVAEWTADCLNLSYLDAPADGSAWGRGICSSHMTRGGSWVTGSREARLPARFNLDNGDRNDFTGFRVVRSVEE